ncbi:MAG: carbohydrate ABC transporter permease, partial [Anaerolineales bacterium]
WFRKLTFAILVLVVALIVIAPVYFMLTMSLGDPQETFATKHPNYVISRLYFAEPGDRDYTDTAWDRILPKWWSRVLLEKAPGGVRLDADLASRLLKSLRVASLTAAISLLIGVPGAYAISRLAPNLKYGLILGLFFTRMYPEVGIALPVAVTFLRLDKVLPFPFYDSPFGLELILAHLIITLPLSTWILVGTFDTIPREMEEAASVDGASRIGTIMRVIIPLAAPGIAVATIFSWLASWDEVTYAIYLTLFHRTLPLEIVNIVGRSPPPVIATYATLVTIPVVFVTYFLQRWLRAGYLAGAIKG